MAQNNAGFDASDVPPPYLGSYPGPGAGQPPVVIAQPGVILPGNVVPVPIGAPVGPKPAAITCRSCNEKIVTRVELKSSTKTHLMAVLLCCVCCPCSCLPYCIDSCHNADHYCPKCNAYIGSYKN